MDTDLIVALFIGVAFGAALIVPAVQAYRGQYRSWIYRGFGTRYGAFAVGGIGAGVILMFTAAVIGSDHAIGYGIFGGLGFLLVVAGLIGFAWMPRALVPAWRQALLDNARLYRSGTDKARLTSTIVDLRGDRVLAVYRRSAPVVDSEYVALSATGMHVRPRLRLPATLSGALPERTSGARTKTVTEIRGDLIADADAVLFVQEPAADAEFSENCFAVVPGPPDESEVSDSTAGATWTLATADADRPLWITVAGISAEAFLDDLRRATRPRRTRQNVHGAVSR